MGDVVPFPAGRVDRDQLRRDAEHAAHDTTQLPAGEHVPPRHVIWQGPDKAAFIQAHPDPRDPPGTIRWIAVQPDGRCVPPGGRILGR